MKIDKAHQAFYTHNAKYAQFLETQDVACFEKYVDALIKSSKTNNHILEVGCGTGIALNYLQSKANRNLHGVDISQSSIKIAQKKGLNCSVYDGSLLPFKNKSFNVVGSINTLEHTDDPTLFLDENLRVLKKNGILIVACPNFLSVTNNYHYHTRGIIQKIRNMFGIITRLLLHPAHFKKMQTINKPDFEPDDDACNVTNPIDILTWGRKNKLQVVSISAHQIPRQGLLHALDFYPLNILFGSCFIIFKITK